MLVITFHVPSRYRLDNEDHYRGKEKWNSVQTLDTAGGFGLRRRLGSSFDHDQIQDKTTGLAAT